MFVISSLHPHVMLGCVNGFWKIVPTEFANEWRLLWNTISDFKIVIICVNCFTSRSGILQIKHETFHIQIASNWLGDGVNTLCIVWIIVRVQWWCNGSIYGGEISITLIKFIIQSFCYLCRFIYKLKPKTILEIIWCKPIHEDSFVIKTFLYRLMSFLTWL